MTIDQDPLALLFDPRSIAVVGASSQPEKWGHQYAAHILKGEARRKVFLVNAKGETVLGRQTYRSALDLPQAIDTAILCVPRDAVPAAAQELCQRGVKFIVSVTAGFAETGQEGQALQRRLIDTVKAAGARLVGPNCIGLFDAKASLSGTAFWDMPPGDIGLVSQSGGVLVELADRLTLFHLGYSRALSIGNQTDVTIAETIQSFAADPASKAVAAYIEDFRDGRAVLRAMEAALKAGKPVVALVPGAHEAVERAVSSHTASLVGDDAAIDSAFADIGALRVRSVTDFLLALRGFAAPVRARGTRVAVFSDGGGSGTIGTDAAVQEGLQVPAFTPQLSDSLRPLAAKGSGLANPIDVVGVLDLKTFLPLVEKVAASGRVDGIVITGVLKNFNPVVVEEEERQVARLLMEATAKHGVALALSTSQPQEPAMIAFTKLGVVVADDPILAARSLFLARARQTRRPIPALPTPAAPIKASDYFAARDLFAGAGIAFSRARKAVDLTDALAAAEALGFPLVLKALAANHKSDSGGVVLNLRSEAELKQAFAKMAGLAAPAFSIEEMVNGKGGVEILIGGTRDRRFGPTVTVAFGGSLTEAINDTVTALAPVDESYARDMLRRLKAARLLAAFRGREAVDLGALSQAIARFSEVFAAHPELAEAEINPAIALGKGVIAVDARLQPGKD